MRTHLFEDAQTCTRCARSLPLSGYGQTNGGRRRRECNKCRLRREKRSTKKAKAADRIGFLAKQLKYQHQYRYRNPERCIWNRTRQSARVRGLAFDILESDIHIPEKCPVFGIPLNLKPGRRRTNNHDAPSLDRIDNTKGYVRGNVIVVSNRANLLKKDATVEEMCALSQYYYGLKAETL